MNEKLRPLKKVIEMASDTSIRSASLETQVAAVVARVDMLVGEMREQNKMRAAEISELRRSIEETNKSTDAKIASIDAKIDSTNKHIRNLSYTSIAAIAAMVITVLLNLPK